MLEGRVGSAREVCGTPMDVRNRGEVEIFCSDDPGEFASKEIIRTCTNRRIKRELTTTGSATFDEVASRALGHIENTATAVRI